MKVIVYAATKGGTGKTTLAYNTAIEVAKSHQVLFADLDPQLSLKAMWEKRPERLNPRLVANITDLPNTLEALRAAGYQHDYLFIDTPGSLMPTIRSALKCADCIVLPVQPSQVDWIGQEAVADMVDEMGLTDRMVFVVNRTEERDAMNARTKQFFASRTKNPIPMIRRRNEYRNGFEKGLAGVELSAEASKEIRALWAVVEKVLDQKPEKQPAEKSAQRRRGRIYDRTQHLKG